MSAGWPLLSLGGRASKEVERAAIYVRVTGAFAEFERSIIRQRIKAGLKRAVAQGTRLGRPKIDVALERKAQKQLKKGVGIVKLAKTLGLGTGTVQRIKQEMGAV